MNLNMLLFLMTSLKNERDRARLSRTSDSLSLVFLSIHDDDKYRKASDKILNNLCDDVSTSHATLQRVVSELSCTALSESLPQLWSRLEPLLSDSLDDIDEVKGALEILVCISAGLKRASKATLALFEVVVPRLVMISCTAPQLDDEVAPVARQMCSTDADSFMRFGLDSITSLLKSPTATRNHRIKACELLKDLVDLSGAALPAFVPELLPLFMSLMTDTVSECAGIANYLFAQIVRVAPLAASYLPESSDDDCASVVAHLVLGKPLPPCKIPAEISSTLSQRNVTVRGYQMEGISWLTFLRSVNLNGALCDEMGLGVRNLGLDLRF